MASNNNEMLIDAQEARNGIKYRYYKWEKMTNEEGLKVLEDHLERVKNGSCEGRPNVRTKVVPYTEWVYCDDWEDIKPYEDLFKKEEGRPLAQIVRHSKKKHKLPRKDYLKKQNKSAIIITKFMRYAYKDNKKSYLNWSIKTNIKDFKEEFGCDIDTIKELKEQIKELKDALAKHTI